MDSFRIAIAVLFICLAFDPKALEARPSKATNGVALRNGSDILRLTFEEYKRQRKALIQAEIDAGFESDVFLTPNEILANEVIMRAKKKELDEGHLNPEEFNPSRHIFEVLDDIQYSDLFKILRKMPKGGILHAHSTALCSANYLVNITYVPNLWQCTRNSKVAEFRFSKSRPKPVEKIECKWILVAQERERIGAPKFDSYIRTLFTLYDRRVNPKTQFSDINAVWDRLMAIFAVVGPLLGYVPVWRGYYKQALQEMYDDNVQYLEVRSSFGTVRAALCFIMKLLSSLSYQSCLDRFMTWMDGGTRKRRQQKCSTKLCSSSSKSIQTSLAQSSSMRLGKVIKKTWWNETSKQQ